MALTVTPTSGDAPYILSADIAGSEYVDGVHYTATLRTATAVGECPFSTAGSTMPQSIVTELLNEGSVSLGIATVPQGSCQVIALRIIEVGSESLASIERVSIDNI